MSGLAQAARRRRRSLLLILAGAFVGAGALHAGTEFSRDPRWDDGKAEIDLYDAEEPLEGLLRRFEARLIIVKEDFLKDTRVKSDAGPVPGKTVPVLKLNHVRLIPTGTYDYHQMLSVVLDRERWVPMKLTMAHFESCGITFVEAIPRGGLLELTSHSYWDGEGDRVLKIPFASGSLLYDALPLQLRGWDFSSSSPRPVRILPRQLAGRVRNVSLVDATVRMAGRERVTVPAGSFDTFQVQLERHPGMDRYFFEAELPHRLVRWESPEGMVYRLRKSVRLDYWNHHDIGEEKLLEERP